MCKVWELKAGSPAGTIVCKMCRQFREWFINIKFTTLRRRIKAKKRKNLVFILTTIGLFLFPSQMASVGMTFRGGIFFRQKSRRTFRAFWRLYRKGWRIKHNRCWSMTRMPQVSQVTNKQLKSSVTEVWQGRTYASRRYNLSIPTGFNYILDVTSQEYATRSTASGRFLFEVRKGKGEL